MALRVTGGKALPAEILDQILERTDGVPLFLEELTRTMLESGLMTDAGNHYELAGAAAPAFDPGEPARFADGAARPAGPSQGARPDRRRNRPVLHELLAAVADRPQEQLENWLDRLVASELVFRRGSPPDAAYSFKHALVKGAAYQSLLKSRRQQPHARIADVFEERFPAVVETQPELLAYHLTEAGLDARAADAWARARGPRPVGDAGGGELAVPGRRTAPGNVGLARSTAPRARTARRPSESLSPIRSARPLPKLRRRASARISVPGTWRPQGPVSRSWNLWRVYNARADLESGQDH
jgi:hypothetical protein